MQQLSDKGFVRVGRRPYPECRLAGLSASPSPDSSAATSPVRSAETYIGIALHSPPGARRGESLSAPHLFQLPPGIVRGGEFYPLLHTKLPSDPAPYACHSGALSLQSMSTDAAPGDVSTRDSSPSSGHGFRAEGPMGSPPYPIRRVASTDDLPPSLLRTGSTARKSFAPLQRRHADELEPAARSFPMFAAPRVVRAGRASVRTASTFCGGVPTVAEDLARG